MLLRLSRKNKRKDWIEQGEPSVKPYGNRDVAHSGHPFCHPIVAVLRRLLASPFINFMQKDAGFPVYTLGSSIR